MTNPDVRWRPAAAEDSEFAYQVKKATLAEHVAKVWGWDEAEQRRLHERRFAARKYIVIQYTDTDVGILVSERRPDCVEVLQLFILPEHQSQGIGTACMDRLFAEAAADALPVRLRVLSVNRRAQGFYRRLGFVQIDQDDTHTTFEKRP